MEIKVIRCDVCNEKYMLDDEQEVKFATMQVPVPVQPGVGNGYAIQVCTTCISYMPWKGKTYELIPERLATSKEISFELEGLETEPVGETKPEETSVSS
jgi:uncharacterized protein with PIN domain